MGGQSFVTYVFESRGIEAMAPIMLTVEGVNISCLILVGVIQRVRKRKAKRVMYHSKSIASSYKDFGKRESRSYLEESEQSAYDQSLLSETGGHYRASESKYSMISENGVNTQSK